ncbi:diguanylate cyclase [Thermosinus carboxydivorans]|nr:diguanylate cyclase [Thermosinus carboxydivorans]
MQDWSKAKLAWLETSADFGLIITDRNFIICSWNYWLEMHSGISSRAAVGKCLFELFPQLRERGIDGKYREALTGRTIVLAQRFHSYLLPLPAVNASRDGAMMQQTAQIMPVRDEAGQVVGTLTVIHDVTERVRREDELRQQIAELETVQRISASILSLDLHECLQMLATKIRSMLRTDFVAVFLCDGDDLILKASTGLTTAAVICKSGCRCLAGQAAARRQAVLSADLAGDGLSSLSDGGVSGMAVPLFADNQLIGALTVEAAVKDAFSSNQLQQLERLAALAAVAISHAKMYDITRVSEERYRVLAEELAANVRTLGKRNQQMVLLQEVGQAVQRCTSTDEAYQVVAAYGPQLFPGVSGGLYVYEEDRDFLRLAAVWGDYPPELAGFVARRCWDEGRIDYCRWGRDCALLLASRGDSSWCIPLIANGEKTGVINLVARSASGSAPVWPEDDSNFAVTVADHLALALANLRLKEKLYEQAIRDPLTGLYNRRYMEEVLAMELAQTERTGGTIGVIMLDIDFFKRVNDSYGHEAGDVVLKRLGRFIAESVRKGDIACRFGGEEFAVILPNTLAEAVCRRAEQLRQGFAGLAIIYREKIVGPLSLSAGVAVYPGDATSGEDLVRLADSRLYQAKQAGRNRVVGPAGWQDCCCW